MGFGKAVNLYKSLTVGCKNIELLLTLIYRFNLNKYITVRKSIDSQLVNPVNKILITKLTVLRITDSVEELKDSYVSKLPNFI
jgi:hypothetical protein